MELKVHSIKIVISRDLACRNTSQKVGLLVIFNS